MKELLKSKTMVGFMVFILGITYVSSNQTHKMDIESNQSREKMITMNLK